jgi:hypothetical protein
MLLTPEQMQDALLRMEADRLELHTIVGQTVSNQARLTETVAKLADTVGDLGVKVMDLAGKHDALTVTVDRLATKVDLLATTVDRFIRSQGDGQNGRP